jgi:hypothetical protein
MPRPARRPLERRLRRVVDVGGVPLGVLPRGSLSVFGAGMANTPDAGPGGQGC